MVQARRVGPGPTVSPEFMGLDLKEVSTQFSKRAKTTTLGSNSWPTEGPMSTARRAS